MTNIPKNLFGDADIGGWNPKQNNFNLLLNIPDLQMRAIAQLLVLGRPENAEWWLSLTTEEQIAYLESTVRNVTYIIPTFPSSVYIPYLIKYANCVLAGETPTDESMFNLYNIDETRFGGRADYNSPASKGTDNYPAIQAAYNAMIDSGKPGWIYVPSNSARWVSRLPNFEAEYMTFGSSDKSARIIFEPDEPSTLCNFGQEAATTQFGSSICNLTIEGFNPDLLTTAQKNARQAKIAIALGCVSHFRLDDVFVKHWYTGSTGYASQGGSIMIETRGKEMIYLNKPWFIGNRAIVFRRNTKEPTSFDLDTFNCMDFDFRLEVAGNANRYGDEYAIEFDGDLEVKEAVFGGSWNISGGAGGAIWEPSTLTRGSNGIKFADCGRLEQQTGSGFWNFKFNMPDGGFKLQRLKIADVSMSFETGGIYLGGVFQSKIVDTVYPRTSLQTTSPLALELRAGTGFPNGVQDLTLDNFYIPEINNAESATLYDFNGATVKFTTNDDEVGKNQLSSRMLIG